MKSQNIGKCAEATQSSPEHTVAKRADEHHHTLVCRVNCRILIEPGGAHAQQRVFTLHSSVFQGPWEISLQFS